MNYTNKVCSFTGYRPKKLNACLANPSSLQAPLKLEDINSCLYERVCEMLDEDFTTFQCGMAIGSDLMFAQAVLKLKQRYSSLVKFIAVLPCLNHDKGWSEAERLQCREIIEKADDVVLINNSPYFDGCMAKRNRYLVETCDELLAVYDGQRGGTMQTINYAKGRGLKITVIDPSRSVMITLRESLEESYIIERNLL